MEQSDRKAAINKREHLCQNRHVQTKTETLPFNKEWLFTFACPDPVAPIATFSLFSDASFFWSSPADSSFPAFHPLHFIYLLPGPRCLSDFVFQISGVILRENGALSFSVAFPPLVPPGFLLILFILFQKKPLLRKTPEKGDNLS